MACWLDGCFQNDNFLSFSDGMDTGCHINVARERSYDTPYAASPLLPLLLMSLCAQKHTPDTKEEIGDEYDFVIIGAGSAGSVVASRLSDIPCVKVLVVEAGPSSPQLTDIPGLFGKVEGDLDWEFKTVPQRCTAARMKNRKVPMPAAKAVGGGSIHNDMIYLRGNRLNYDRWEALGATGWSNEGVFPYFLMLENNTDPNFQQNGYHTVGGPITASRPNWFSLKKVAVTNALLNCSYQFTDPNAWEQIGIYDVQYSMKEGQRCSTAKGYLVPVEKRQNLDIVTNVMVRKIIIEDGRAVGIKFDYKNQTRTVLATKEVILSAGTVKSAQILQLSGIGPMCELKRHKLPVHADLPVGLNFHDHPAVVLLYEVDSKVHFEKQLKEDRSLKEYIEKKTGPLTSPGGVLLITFRSNVSPDNPIPDYQMYFQDTENVPFTPPGYKEKNTSYIICGVQLTHPYSRGTVNLKSTDPYDDPLIDPRYFSDYRDVHDMILGLKECNRIMKDPAMQAIGTRPVKLPFKDCDEFSDNEYLFLSCYITLFCFSPSHPVGTARMGQLTDPWTVVDPTLRVKGIDALRVVDASVMPEIPWCNTNIPTIMVAEKASDIIKQSMTCNSNE